MSILNLGRIFRSTVVWFVRGKLRVAFACEKFTLGRVLWKAPGKRKWGLAGPGNPAGPWQSSKRCKPEGLPSSSRDEVVMDEIVMVDDDDDDDDESLPDLLGENLYSDDSDCEDVSDDAEEEDGVPAPSVRSVFRPVRASDRRAAAYGLSGRVFRRLLVMGAKTKSYTFLFFNNVIFELFLQFCLHVEKNML